MAKNDWITYIFGKWPAFVGFLFSSIITVIGVMFMGGAFVQLRDSEPFNSTKPEIPIDAIPKTGLALYKAFCKYILDLLFYNIQYIINTIMYYLQYIPVPILLFLLPLGVTFFLPFLFPCIVALTVIGLLISRPSDKTGTSEQTHPFRYLIIPPFALFSYFCESCTKKISSYFSIEGMIHLYTYIPMLWYYSMVMLMYCFANVISVGVISGIGWAYFIWYVFIRPLHYNIATKTNDWFHYLKIKAELAKYTSTLLIVFSLIYFTGATLYLGHPLRVTALVVFISSLLWLLYNHIKNYDKIA
jgi:hypothetical protein